MGQQNNCILNTEQPVEQITVLKQNVSSVNTKAYTLETVVKHIKPIMTVVLTPTVVYVTLCLIPIGFK